MNQPAQNNPSNPSNPSNCIFNHSSTYLVSLCTITRITWSPWCFLTSGFLYHFETRTIIVIGLIHATLCLRARSGRDRERVGMRFRPRPSCWPSPSSLAPPHLRIHRVEKLSSCNYHSAPTNSIMASFSNKLNTSARPHSLGHTIHRPSSPYSDPRALGPKSQLLALGNSNYHSTSLRNSKYCPSTPALDYTPVLHARAWLTRSPSGVHQPQRQSHQSASGRCHSSQRTH